MKRKLKIAIASILSMALILSVSACSNSEGGGNQQEQPERSSNEEFEDLVQYIGSLSDKVDSSITVDKKIRWLSWWAIDETQAAAELFKQVYGIPEAGDTSYGDDANNIFDYIYTVYADRYTQLAKMVQSGDSPDMFQFEITNFPYTAYKGLFQPIDDYVDLSDSLWDNTKESMKQFQWGGKNYCALATVNLDDVMWYRRSVINEAGLTEPLELYNAGNWTWDTFLDMCDQWQKTGEGKYATDGWRVPDKFVLTTGVPIIGIVDGKLQSNFYDADIERCMNNVIDVLYKQNYRYPRHELNGWSIKLQSWFTGDTLFYVDLTTTYTGSDFQGYMKRYKIDSSDIFCVPIPRDPNADAYYQSFKNDSYMLVGGSQNTAGFAAWTQCVIATAYDEETRAISHEQAKANYDYTDELLDFLDELQFGGGLTPVFDFKAGIGQDVVDSNTVYNPVDVLTQIPYLNCLDADGNPATFTTLRAANEAKIQSRIDDLNAWVDKQNS